MILETKFNVGDCIYTINDSIIIKATISKIDIQNIRDDSNYSIEYEVNFKNDRGYTVTLNLTESQIFETKDDLIFDLLSNVLGE